MNFEELYRELQQIYPTPRVAMDGGQLLSFVSDGLTAFSVRPRAVVFPVSNEEVIETVRACHRHQVPFVARGSGTSLSGGSVPHQDGIIIALNRLNRIIKVDPANRLAVVEPGVINLKVSEAAAPYGLYYAPDPSSQQVCTIGGNVAFNSGGAHCLKYGMTSNHVLGVKAVLSNGTVVQLGGESTEQIGPDLTGFIVGSEGLLGVVLEITLRLLPQPEAFHTVLAGYDSLENAGDAVSRIIASGLLPGALEIMDRLSMEAAMKAVGVTYPQDSEAVLIVELDGSADEVNSQRAELDQLIHDSNAIGIHIAATAEERATIWRGRKSSFSAVGLLSPDFIVQDSVVPRTKLGFALRKISELGIEAGIRVANVFHAGDGNLHPLILYDGRVPGELERAEDLAGKIVKLCVELGGSITGEHGVGMEKRQFLPAMFSEVDLDWMKRVRSLIDPHEVGNRGKMFPDAEAPAMSMYGLHPLEKAGVISRE